MFLPFCRFCKFEDACDMWRALVITHPLTSKSFILDLQKDCMNLIFIWISSPYKYGIIDSTNHLTPVPTFSHSKPMSHRCPCAQSANHSLAWKKLRRPAVKVETMEPKWLHNFYQFVLSQCTMEMESDKTSLCEWLFFFCGMFPALLLKDEGDRKLFPDTVTLWQTNFTLCRCRLIDHGFHLICTNAL